jgi:RHS repeat-associated protein
MMKTIRTQRAMKTLTTILLLCSSLAAQAAPSVSLTAPGDGWAWNAPVNIALRATAAVDPADTGATLVRVEFHADGILIGSDATASSTGVYAVTWNNVPAGSHAITATAFDSLGQTTVSAPATITVTDSAGNLAPKVSLTAPANNAKYAQPADITLTASASDIERNGGITQVEFLADGQVIGSVTAKPWTYIWNNPAAGTYTLTARATDKLGAVTESAARSITVQSPTPPTVSLGGIIAGTYVLPVNFNLTAGASGGEVNTPVTQVEFLANDQVIASVTQKPYTTTWTPTTAGTYVLAARATDSQGLSSTSVSRSVTLNDVNTAPTVKLTAPANNAKYVLPADIAVTASATDLEKNGGVTQVEFLANGQVIGTATAKPWSITWSNPAAGSYTLTARATDNLGAVTVSALRTVTITDLNAAPKVSLTSPANNSTFTAPVDIPLSAAANGTETNTPVTLVEFLIDGQVIASVTTKPYTAIWSNPATGVHSLTVRATDSLGAVTLSAARTVTIVAANQVPSVTLTSPATSTTVTAPATLNLSADATDSNGGIAKVEFYANDGNTNTLVGTATAAPYSATWSNIPAGSYTLTATATDNLGTQTTSTAVTVTVINGEAQVYYIHTDHLDTPRMITDTAGNTVWQYDNSDPFGNNVPNENPSGQGTFTNNLRFAGQYFDKETGLHYNYFRDYDPATGRYKQFDLIGLAGGINGYIYGNGNPLSYTDPYGLFGMSDMPTIPQPVLDFTTGVADAASLGLGPLARKAAGVDGGVNRCSKAYSSGEWASLALGAGRMLYAGLAKVGAAAAADGAAAMAYRNGLKRVMRGPLAGSDFRIKTYEDLLAKYGSDEAIQAAAGRTNAAVNAVGADLAIGGTVDAANCGCQ